MTHVHDPAVFIKSSFSSTDGSCVEVASCACGQVQVRDSKDPDGPVLTYTPPEWTAFVQGVREGQF
jgi:hypothetical protein